MPENSEAEVAAEIDRIRNANGSVKAHIIRSEMQQIMMDHVSVFRTEENMKKALDRVRELKHQLSQLQYSYVLLRSML